MTKAVSVRGITKRYGKFVALDDVSLDIEQGEFLSLLGPSGAGKTTILRMIAGFDRPDTGEIRIMDRNIVDLPSHKRPVNTVFQDYALFPHMSVADNVAYGLRQDRVRGEDRRIRVREALDMVEMTSMAHRRPDELSGGQQQRVALARALVKRPSILLLDEPLGALDRRLRQQMQIELKTLQRETGIAFVLVTHDQDEALAMSDRIVVTRHGRIEQAGTPSDLYDYPRTAFVADFMGSQNFLFGKLDKANKALTTRDGVTLYADRIEDVAGPEALAAVRPENTIITMDEPSPALNRVRGRVIQAMHMGNTMEYVVDLPSGAEVFSRQSRKHATDIPIGSEIWLAWDRADTAIFPLDDEINETTKRSHKTMREPA
ncbi:spermidine/putrescine transport system ATP-binding protein [Roseovarius azorensis]|uniref:Spermidine/putrescine import ATP-binding protein PotA n=1 Tax=Roseovarius azorensis TaxID=1287727 RepID=A0A1H7XFM1_9RHOB|nr:ABC transporter ATP-binding protein [Roseovarius azorensis]SEM32692.1 spermidine/putrescine transport system ATP-binding protein [Roseovarius azorensis]